MLEISNTEAICKPSLSVSGTLTSTINIVEILEVLSGYTSKNKKLILELDRSILTEDGSYPFDIAYEYEFTNSNKIEYFYIEKCVELSGVTLITIFGDIKKLVDFFGVLEPKLLDNYSFTYSQNLQYSENEECVTGDFVISGLGQTSVKVLTNEYEGNFKLLRFRIKEVGTDTWSYYDTTEKNLVITTLKPQTFYYLSYMKFCDVDKHSFYSQMLEFKTF
jgi:hypothetical protein